MSLMNLTEAISNDKVTTKIDKVLKDINKTFNSEDVSLYYIPKGISHNTEDYLVIKTNADSIYYECKLDTDIQGCIINRNPYELISKVSDTINDIYNEEAKMITDTVIVDLLDNLKPNQSVVEIEADKEFKPEADKIKDTLNNVLEKISLPARSNNKEGFTTTDKLDAIDKVLEDSSYNKVYSTKNCVIYGKSVPKKGDKCILVSSHADIVSGITNVSSEYKDRYYHGTYDNLGTNASAVSIMLNDNKLIDNNVYFAFTAEEETGLCTGAKDAFTFITEKSRINPTCIALDVTDEGYEENELISIEGLRGSKQMQTMLHDKLVELDGDSLSFGVTKASSKEYTPFEDAYITCDYTEFDEGLFYGKNLKQNAFSCCLPTDGYMHSNTGLNVKESVFIGYIYSLDTLLQTLTNTLDKSKISDIKAFKDYLVYKTEQISKTPAPQFKNNFPLYHQSWGQSWGMEEEIYEDEGYDDYSELVDALMKDENGAIIDEEAYEYAYETLMDFASSYPDDYDTYISDVIEVYGDVPEEIAKQAYDEFYGLCFDDDIEYDL